MNSIPAYQAHRVTGHAMAGGWYSPAIFHSHYPRIWMMMW
jgi:hypothetical protein